MTADEPAHAPPEAEAPPAVRTPWVALGAIALLGLALRVAAARGALWLDEAWSATMASDVGTPLGVFLKLNHDNNHHLNTLWLQLVGPHATPMLQRALSIASGTAAILLAGRIGARQGPMAAIAAALLFAASPLLVTYGAEARGYAPMLLALLAAMLMVTRWLDDPRRPVPAILLGTAVLLGMLSQLTMIFGLAAMAVWICWALLRERVTRGGLRDVLRILLPLLVPAAAVVMLIFGAGYSAGTGLQIGNFEPFSWWKLVDGVGAMFFAAVGGPLALLVALLLIVPSDSPDRRTGPRRDQRYFFLAMMIPAGVALFQIGNSGAPRYHLISGAAALMLIAIRTAPRLLSPHPLRWPIRAAFALVIAASIITDARIIHNLRGDPGAALALVAAAEPAGGTIAIGEARSGAIMAAAAASRGYPLEIVEAPCPATRFLYVSRDGDAPFPAPAMRCGKRYHAVAEGHPTGLSGTHWKLYARD